MLDRRTYKLMKKDKIKQKDFGVGVLFWIAAIMIIAVFLGNF